MARDLIQRSVFLTPEMDEKMRQIKETTDIPFSIFVRNLLKDELENWEFD